MNAHAIHCRVDLFEIADVGAHAQGVASAVLDFQMSGVEFGLAASQQSDAGAEVCKSDGEALSDAAARTGYKNCFVFEVRGHSHSPQLR